jgi:peptide/nickel transport system substrate-binding protein
MKRRSAVVAVVAATTFALVLSACSSSKSTNNNGSGGNSAKGFNAAANAIYNPSTKKGGTLIFGNPGDWDSLDGADTYYGYSWNFFRLYGRSLVTFKPGPGDASTQLVPDLATSLGQASDGGKTWTYHIRPGLKYSNGDPITSKDVKYAVERSLDKTVFPDGPTYFNDFLDLQGYTSPYADNTPDKLGLKAIETPDDTTIIFHLKTPFSGFDYFAQLPSTAPVPMKADTGSKYKNGQIVSSGPYMFDTAQFQVGKSFVLKRNPNWDPASDPIRNALPDEIDVRLNVNAEDLDNQLINGTIDVDVSSTGVQSDTQARIVNNAQLKANADQAALIRTWWTAINQDVKPFDNIDCRKAVILAMDHDAYLRAFGGSYGGQIATALTPPQVPGASKSDMYNFLKNKNGDVDAAKAELQKCGQPNGFTTNLSYRVERPHEKAAGEAIQQALAKINVTVNLKPFPQGQYYSLYAGKPDFAKNNQLGLMETGWGADWPDGYGFLDQITDGRIIRATGGNSNLGIKDDQINGWLDQAVSNTDVNARNQLWGKIDTQIMTQAYVIPGVWASVLLYRPTKLTNVFVNAAYGGYDFTQMGVSK